MIQDNKIELLAPAGNMIALHAAITAGADAVYLGLNEFNARRGADNFTLQTLKEACDYAHLRGRKIYLTFNIIVFEEEFNHAYDLAVKAANAGIDAFIVQDIGLAKVIAENIPEIRLHISTQMNIHNEMGLRAVAALGAKRVTLARELSIEEINNLVKVGKELGVETECFGHGALCVCYSGQCLMSSMIGGRSANRGTCAQACRLEYEMSGSKEGPHLLSPKDLCSIDILNKLNVDSLKIEGRMKSPEYVYSVVSIYRNAIDNGARPNDKQKLAEVFSRGFTTAYLENKRGNEIMSYKRPNNRGVNIGRIKSVNNKSVLDTKVNLVKGDVLEVWTNKGRETFVYPNVNFRNAKANDRVFRVRSAEASFNDNATLPKVKVDAKVRLKLGEKLQLKLGDVIVEGNIIEKARTKAVIKEDIIKHIDRFGGTDFELGNIKVDLDDNVGIGFSELHHVRAEAVEKLKFDSARNISKKKIKARKPAKTKKDITICALVTNPITARRVKADKIYIPALNFKRGTAMFAGEASEAVQATYPKNYSLVMPTILHDGDEIEFSDNFIADNLAEAIMAGNVEVGQHIPVVNNQSVEFFEDLGVKRIWLSPELTIEQIKSITSKNWNLSFGLYIAGNQELMVTEHCELMSMGECNHTCLTCARRKTLHYLKDKKGYKFPVTTDVHGRGHIYNSFAMDAIYCIEELIDAGIDSFMIDTTLMTAEQAAQTVGRAVARVKDKPRNTTTGHLFRRLK